MTELVNVLISGAVLGAVYLLVAAGVSVVFGQTRIVNFAHGEFLVIGGLITWSCIEAGMPYPIAVVLATGAIALFAFASERTVLRNLGSNPLSAFVVTLGLLLVLQEAAAQIWGPQSHQVRPPLTGAFTLGEIRLPYNSAIILAAAAAVYVLIYLTLKRSALGRQARACAEDPEAASHVGVSIRRITSIVFVAGSALAGFAGCLLAINYPISPYDGGTYVLIGFAIALVGGLGSISGAALAAIAFGVLETLGQAYWDAAWVPALSFVLIIVTLILRPQGLFGRSALPTESVVAHFARHIPAPRWAPIAGVAIAVLALLVPALGVTSSALYLATVAIAWSAQALSIGWLFRTTGVLSLAHGTFLGVAALGSGYAAVTWDIGFWLALPLAFVVCLLLGALCAVPLLRTRGLYLLIVGFAVTDMAALIERNVDIFGGSLGLTVLTPPGSVLGFEFTDESSLYRLFVVLLVLLVLASWALGRSEFGKRLEAIRDNEVLARSLGLAINPHLVIAFAISAGLSGIAGVMFLYATLAVTPAMFTGLATVMFPIMVILGGARSLVGPIVGAFLLAFLPYWLNIGSGLTQLMYGASLILVATLATQGVVPSIYELTAAARRRTSAILPSGRRTSPGKPKEV